MKKRIIAILVSVIVIIVLSFLLLVNSEGPKNYDDISSKRETVIKNSNNSNEVGLIDPTQICVDSKENIFVLESSEKCIKKYSKDGSFLQKIGRSGSGPGEIQSCYSMKIDNSDNIILYDQSRKKLIRFNNGGKLISEIDVPISIESFTYGKDDMLFIESTKEGTLLNKNGRLNILSWYSPGLKKQKGIDSCLIKNLKQLTNPSVGIELPYYYKLLWSTSGNNIWVVFTENYKVKLYSEKGVFIKSFNGKANQVRVTESDKKSFFARLHLNTSEGQSSLYGVPIWLEKAIEFPTYKPLISDLLSDSDGSIIIKTAEEVTQKNIWDLYTTDGVYVKSMLVPSVIGGDNSFLRNGYLYAILKADGGNFTVERYSINR